MHLSCLSLCCISLCMVTAGLEAAEPDGAWKSRVSAVRAQGPMELTFADLQAFGKAVGDARCVVLGEQSHGDGNVYALKARLVAYLHEVMGFEVLAMESGFWDGARADHRAAQGNPMKAEVRDSFFYMYADSLQVAPLYDYLDAQRGLGKPMFVAAFDNQHTSKKALALLVPELKSELIRRGIPVAQDPNWATFEALSGALFQMDRSTPGAALRDTYFRLLARMDQVFAADPVQGTQYPEGAGFWRRVLAGQAVQARRFWALDGKGQAEDDHRDAAMAENLQWLLQTRFPGKKVIIWAHDGHGMKRLGLRGFTGMMERVRRALPRETFYHVHFTGRSGTYFDFNSGKNKEIQPRGLASLEAVFGTLNLPCAFLDLSKPGSLPSSLKTFRPHINWTFELKVPIADYADGVFCFDAISPAVR